MDPATLSTFFKGLDFPASRSDVLETAKGNDAPTDIQETIQSMPDHSYEGMADVMDEFGKASSAAAKA